MPTTHKLKRINIGLPSLYLKKLERYSALIGLTAAPTTAYPIQTKLDELEKEGKLDEPSDVLAHYIDVLSGIKSAENLDIKTLSRLTGKPVEVLEANINEFIKRYRGNC